MAIACGGTSAQDLEALLVPAVEAQDLLEDFQRQVEGGLTYGDVLEQWPQVSADVRGLIDDITDELETLADLSEADLEDLTNYVQVIAASHDSWSHVHSSVGDFIRDDAPESDISTRLNSAIRVTETLDAARAVAINPGQG
jgi:hypothetical protein